MPSKSKTGARNRIEPAKTGKALLAQLNADPCMPPGYTLCEELSIFEEDEDEFAQVLFDFAQDPTNVKLMEEDDRNNVHELAARFLDQETKLIFWNPLLVETEHKFMNDL